VAKAATQTASAKQRALNTRAISQLRSVSKSYSGTTLAKEASALERALASSNPSKATTQRLVQSFAQEATKYPLPSRVGKMTAAKTVKGKGRSKDAATKKTGTPGIVSRARASASNRYKTRVFKCVGDYGICCQQADWRFCAAWLAVCISNELQVLKALGLGPAAYVAVKSMIGH
jgi:hypothetical protein